MKFADEILAEYTSQKVHWIGRGVSIDVIMIYDTPLVGIGSCLGLIGTRGWLSIKGKSLQISLLSQRNSRILGEVKTEGSLTNSYLDV